MADHRCEFTYYARCQSTDTEQVEMYDGGTVYVCPSHRSWVPAMGAEPGVPDDPDEIAARLKALEAIHDG